MVHEPPLPLDAEGTGVLPRYLHLQEVPLSAGRTVIGLQFGCDRSPLGHVCYTKFHAIPLNVSQLNARLNNGRHSAEDIILISVQTRLPSLTASQFPYALQALPSTLATQWDAPEFQPYRSAFPTEYASSPAAFSAHVHDLTSRDLKIPYLKSLQGYLWHQGYQSGALKCPLFPDVPRALDAWHAAGVPIVIYSSGSVAAQKLLFQYTDAPAGDLRPLLAGYFDTVNAGPKTDAASYEKIAATRGEGIGSWLFLSDNPREVDAAKEAGMQSLVVFREGNAPLSDEAKRDHKVIESFDEVHIKGLKK
jgi:enolase-phosphatase E1